MSLSKFAKSGTAQPSKAAPAQGGGRFGGKPAPATAAAPRSRFQQAPAEEETEEQEPTDTEEAQEPPQRAGRFGRSNDAAPAQGRGRGQQRGGQGRVHIPQRGRFTGTRSKKPLHPWLEDGEHWLKIVKTYESYKPGTGPRLFIQIEVVHSENPTHAAGSMATVKYNTDDAAFGATADAIFMFVRAGSGFESDDEFIEVMGEDGHQDLIDAVHGNKEAERCLAPSGKPFGENPLGGEYVRCIGRKGNRGEESNIQFYDHDWFPWDGTAPF